MKPFIPYSLLAAAALCGVAFGQTATTTPVGYVTESLSPGFNFVGLTLHESTVAAGLVDSVTANSIVAAGLDFDTALAAGATYVLEIYNGSGIVQVTSSWTGSSITTAADLTADVAPGDSFTIRPVATLASVFGNAAAGHKLDIGGGGSGGADQVWFWNGSGYDRFYFDEFAGEAFDQESWVNVDTSALVDGSSVNLIYADGFIITSANGRDVTISGEVKTGVTELNLASGFNFVGSVAPVGMTLEAAFGSSAATTQASGLAIGGGGSGGADQVWIWDGSAFSKYYFDEFAGESFDQESWVNIDTSALIPATTPLPSGYIITGAGGNILQGVPEDYDKL